jgi:hypothetical protein
MDVLVNCVIRIHKDNNEPNYDINRLKEEIQIIYNNMMKYWKKMFNEKLTKTTISTIEGYLQEIAEELFEKLKLKNASKYILVFNKNNISLQPPFEMIEEYDKAGINWRNNYIMHSNTEVIHLTGGKKSKRRRTRSKSRTKRRVKRRVKSTFRKS